MQILTEKDYTKLNNDYSSLNTRVEKLEGGGYELIYSNNTKIDTLTATLSKSVTEFKMLLIVFDDYFASTATHTYKTMIIPTNTLNRTYSVSNVFPYDNNWYGGVRSFYIRTNTTIYFDAYYRWLDNSILQTKIEKGVNGWLNPVQIYGIK